MKKLLVVLFAVAFSAAAGLAHDNDDDVVRWRSIVGVITTPGVNNPVAGINAGATAWTTRGGRASVNLATGFTSFEVEGLVINGTNSTGTPGPITEVEGTLVCGAGSTTQIILDTTPVSLSVHGDARFFGHLSGVPTTCANPLFLVRIAAPAGAAGRWIGTGVERFIGDDGK
jgi:hypothetical protein